MRRKPDSPVATRMLPSPNHGARTRRGKPDSIILHYTGMPTGAEALVLLCNPLADVSCHYFVWESGKTLQLVPERRRAWHAGKSWWKGETDMNSLSLGIEIVNRGHDASRQMPAYPEPQIDAVITLCRDICARYGIAPQRVLAHSDIAPARKIDPGEAFPWQRLYEAGVGHWVKPVAISDGQCLTRGDSGEPVRALQEMLALYGYGLDITGDYDDTTMAVVGAFQRHFRPDRVDGVADASTITTLRDLLAALPASCATVS